MNRGRSRPDAADAAPATWHVVAVGRLRRRGRCQCCGSRVRRVARADWWIVLNGMIQLGLCMSGVPVDLIEATQRWREDLRDPQPPCCTAALPDGFRPDGETGA